MLCPACALEQAVVEVDGVELDACVQCGGLWFDAEELRQLLDRSGAPQSLRDLERRLLGLPRSRGAVQRCPRCRRRMEHAQLAGRSGPVTLDLCGGGHGVWFDRGELEEVVEGALAAGDPALAAVLEHVRRFAAPRGGRP